MKNKQTNVLKRRSLLVALAAVIGFLATACPADDPTPQTVTYSGTAGGTTYTLTITENTAGRYTAKNGDSYVLTVGTKTSSGTVTVNGSTLTLTPSSSGASAFTVTVSASGITAMGGTITFDDGATQTAPAIDTPTPPPNTGNPSDGNIAPFVLTGVQAKDYNRDNSTLTKDFHYIYSLGDRISDLIENPSVKLINGKVSISFDKPKNWNPQSGNLFLIYLTFTEGDNGEVILGYQRNGISANPGGNVSLIYTETARILTENDMLEIFPFVYDNWETVNLNVSLQRGWNYMVLSYDDRDTATITSGAPNNEFEWLVYVR